MAGSDSLWFTDTEDLVDHTIDYLTQARPPAPAAVRCQP